MPDSPHSPASQSIGVANASNQQQGQPLPGGWTFTNFIQALAATTAVLTGVILATHYVTVKLIDNELKESEKYIDTLISEKSSAINQLELETSNSKKLADENLNRIAALEDQISSMELDKDTYEGKLGKWVELSQAYQKESMIIQDELDQANGSSAALEARVLELKDENDDMQDELARLRMEFKPFETNKLPPRSTLSLFEGRCLIWISRINNRGNGRVTFRLGDDPYELAYGESFSVRISRNEHETDEYIIRVTHLDIEAERVAFYIQKVK